MSAEVKLTTRNALRVLRPGPFRRYIIGSAISDTGTWMQVMTQGWVMATLTTSAFMLGLVQLCAGLSVLDHARSRAEMREVMGKSLLEVMTRRRERRDRTL